MKIHMTRQEVASILERFAKNEGGPYEWDDFCSAEIANPFLDEIRRTCCNIDGLFAPSKKREYTNENGVALLLRVAEALKEHREEDVLRMLEKESR